MKPILQKNLQFGDIWPRNCQKIARTCQKIAQEVFGHFLGFALFVFLDFLHNDRWAWCLVVFLQFVRVNVYQGAVIKHDLMLPWPINEIHYVKSVIFCCVILVSSKTRSWASCVNENKTMNKSCSAQNCQNRKKNLRNTFPSCFKK